MFLLKKGTVLQFAALTHAFVLASGPSFIVKGLAAVCKHYSNEMRVSAAVAYRDASEAQIRRRDSLHHSASKGEEICTH